MHPRRTATAVRTRHRRLAGAGRNADHTARYPHSFHPHRIEVRSRDPYEVVTLADSATTCDGTSPAHGGIPRLHGNLARASYPCTPTTAAELAAKCHKAALDGRWKTCMNFFAGPRLLIIDELGYLPLPEDGASALFQVINQRYLKSSTILSTNVGIADWASAFGDATVAAAMLDRLLHRATVVGIDGPSYRLRHHQSHAETLRQGVNARVS
ncbi:ATP-binding protein [Streptomyces mirabilis]|uniref:ATP-binding protein n=1 Tax=Streptomyces mirabilis TaxID=68239 RepID=UPI00201E073A|nr:ATP-binding protein [Streptomyces mirabilis]